MMLGLLTTECWIRFDGKESLDDSYLARSSKMNFISPPGVSKMHRKLMKYNLKFITWVNNV